MLSVGPSRHDFCKLKSLIHKIRKKKSINIGDISSIYRYFTDISDTKCRFVKNLKKKPKKKKKPILADISAIYRLVSASLIFFLFFFLIFDLTAVVLGHVEG